MDNYEPIHDPEDRVTEQRTVADSGPLFLTSKQKHISTLWYIANMIHYTDDYHNFLSDLNYKTTCEDPV